jgi:hypothetical protein
MGQPEINIQASRAWLKKSNIYPETNSPFTMALTLRRC